MKTKYNKWISVFLAVLMLFTSVPINTFSINGQTSSEVSSENSTEISSEESTSSEIISSESEISSTESSEIISSEEDLSTENISSENTSTKPIADENAIAQIDVDGDDLEGTDNWELDVVFYDSTVDGGNTPLTEINWDGNVDTNNRIIKVQINYKNTNVVTSYDVGELAIAVPNLIYKNGNYEGTMYNANLSATAIVGANDSTHTGYAWDFASGISASTSQKEYIFTNAIPIEENANLEGSIQIEYTLKLDHRTEKYEDSCTSSYNTTLKAVLRETCPRSTTPDISSSDFNLSYYSTVYLEYSDPDPDTTQLKIRFSEYSYLFEFHKFKIYDEAGNVVYELKGVLGDSQYVTNMAGKTFVIDGNYLKIEFTPAGSGNMYDPYSFSIYVNENPEKRVIAESNEISFSYTKSYIHPWEQREYTITKNAYKVASLDGFPKGDYYWVKYSFATYGYYGDSYPEIGISEIYMKDQLPEGCVVLDNDLEPIEWDNELYDIYDKDDNYYDGPSTNTIYLYVGYPKSIYNDANNNLNITNHVDLYVKYNNEEEYKLVDDSEVSINLADFEFTYEGDLYSINKSKYYNCHGKLYSHFLLKENYVHNCSYNCSHIGTGLNWNIAATAIYTGSPMTVKFGDDLVYITDSSGNYRKLTDEEYWFDYVEIPTLKNKNDVTINEDKYPYKLYVRYANEEEYTLHSTITSSTYPYLYFDSDKKVVAYYFQVEDLEESLVTTTTNRSASIHVKPKDNIASSGTIYNFAFIQVYFKDSEGNLILQNEAGLDNYSTLITQDTIAQYDLDTYGHYVQRDEAFGTYSDYYEINIDAKADVSKSKYYTSPVQDAANECFHIEYEFKTSLDGTQFNIVPEEYVSNPEIIREVYLSGSGTVKMLSGFRLYDLLPKGMEINSTESELLDSIVAWTGSNPPEDHIFMADGTKPFSDSQDVKEFIQKYSTFNIIKNWNNTGRTKVEWVVDFSEEPIFLLGENVDLSFYMNTLVSYDSYIEYGGVWKNNAYLESFYADGTKIDYGSINDNGYIDYEASDINSNGIINEKLDHSSSEVTLNAVISTHQDVTTFIQTDKSTFTTGGVYASENSQYQYKLRVRTGVADVTNLIIYDNLEEAYGNKEYWKGEFLEIDTSYAESKGYTVKPYYSTNSAAGNLYNEDGTLNSDWNEYIPDTPAVYAEGLEITFSDQCRTERNTRDYVIIYYKLNETVYKLGQWGGTELAGLTVQVPTNDFYLHWVTSASNCSYYGFSIDSITHKNIEHTITTTGTIPSYIPEEISGNIYPDSAFDSYTHGNYGNSVSKVWHYTYTGEKELVEALIPGTDKSLVKSLAFEYLDSEGNPAVLPANSMTYVIINMKAPTAGEDVIYAYNQCWTNWNALDEFEQPVDFITGINSNIVRVTTNYYFDLTVNKTWVDNNNELNLRPDSVDIILKLKGEEIDRKQITIDNLAVTFTDLLTSQMEYYTLEEEYLALYNASEFVFDNETNEYNITNTLKDNILTTINGTKTWENDTEEKRPESITIKLLQDGIQIASTTTTAEQNWEYSFENVVKYKPDGTYHKYTVEESPVNNYFTSYGYSGVILKFNASSKTENEKYDYVEIFYDLYGTTHSLGKIGGADIAGKTVEIPSTNFYLYWHTNGSNSKYYGFKIDSITPADVNIPINATPIYSDSEKPWNNYTAENITTISSLDSAFGSYTHSNYGNNVNKVWYYTSNYKSNFDITNSKNATSISGIKTWENDTEDVRPESITIKLLQDGTEIATTTTSAEKIGSIYLMMFLNLDPMVLYMNIQLKKSLLIDIQQVIKVQLMV